MNYSYGLSGPKVQFMGIIPGQQSPDNFQYMVQWKIGVKVVVQVHVLAHMSLDPINSSGPGTILMVCYVGG